MEKVDYIVCGQMGDGLLVWQHVLAKCPHEAVKKAMVSVVFYVFKVGDEQEL